MLYPVRTDLASQDQVACIDTGQCSKQLGLGSGIKQVVTMVQDIISD